MKLSKSLPIAALSAIPAANFAAPPDFTVVGGDKTERTHWIVFTDVENSLYRHLMEQAVALADERAARVAEIDTLEEWTERQQWLTETFHELVGPFPEKTPLNARVTGVLEKESYRVEKVLFESLPGYPVTAALYIPAGLKGKAPAVLFCAGHNIQLSFRSEGYQKVILNLVDKGFIVLAFDPVGQGERRQYWDHEKNEPYIWTEHSFVAGQAFAAGAPTARYFIWDGIRALDYLETRPEVDTSRMGVTGNSGGGTQAAYISAFDDRLRATAISCYITSVKRLFQLDGPQDGEQNWIGDITAGIDFSDLITIQAPRPTLIATTSNDFFSVQGAYESYAEANRIYELLGEGERVKIVEDTSTHGFTDANVQEIIAFFQDHLELPGDPTVHDLPSLTREELYVTETGQVSAMAGARSLFEVLKERAEPLLEDLQESRQSDPGGRRSQVIENAMRISGYNTSDSPVDTSVYTGRLEFDGYLVEKRFIDGEGDYPLPYLLFLPENVQSPEVVLYLNPEGKAAEAAPGGEIEAIVKQGYAVLAADLLGKGELGPGVFKGDSFNFNIEEVSFNIQFAALRLGRSLPGIRASDITRLVDQVKRDKRLSEGRLIAVGKDGYATALAHAAAFDNRIDAVALVGGLGTFSTIVQNKIYQPSLFHEVVPAALTAYDLPDLEATLAPRPLLLLDQVDHTGKSGAFTSAAEELQVLRRAYSNSSQSLTIQLSSEANTRSQRLMQWLDGQRED